MAVSLSPSLVSGPGSLVAGLWSLVFGPQSSDDDGGWRSLSLSLALCLSQRDEEDDDDYDNDDFLYPPCHIPLSLAPPVPSLHVFFIDDAVCLKNAFSFVSFPPSPVIKTDRYTDRQQRK